MKRLCIGFIRFYQAIPLSIHNQCRFYPTCSNYTIMAITKYGVLKGILMGLKRILKCNPCSKGGIDYP